MGTWSKIAGHCPWKRISSLFEQNWIRRDGTIYRPQKQKLEQSVVTIVVEIYNFLERSHKQRK